MTHSIAFTIESQPIKKQNAACFVFINKYCEQIFFPVRTEGSMESYGQILFCFHQQILFTFVHQILFSVRMKGSMGCSRQILFCFHQQILFSVRTKGSMGRSRQILSSQATEPCSMSHLGSSNPRARLQHRYSDFFYVHKSQDFLADRSSVF